MKPKNQWTAAWAAMLTMGLGASALGQVTAGADFEVDAGLDTDGDQFWEDITPGNPSGFGLLLDDSPAVTRVTAVTSTQLTHAYDFPGGEVGNEGGALLVETDSTVVRSFLDGPSGNWTVEDVTLEMWVKPDNINPTASNGWILFEDGGGSGLGVFIANNELICTQDGNQFPISHDLSTSTLLLGAPTAEFFQVVVTREASGATVMYLNGQAVGSATDDDGGWSGGDDAGFGTRGANNVGGRGSDQQNTESFDGQMALIRMYRNQVLTPSEVQANFDALSGPDLVDPSITALDPADDSATIFPGTDLVAEFSEDVALNTGGSITITDINPGTAPPVVINLSDTSQVDVTDNVLTINPPANLAFGTEYEVTIAANTILDLAAIPNDYDGTTSGDWTFATASQDLTAPLITALDPADDAPAHPAANPLTVTFDDPILLETATSTTFLDQDFEGGDGGFTASGDWESGPPDSNNGAGFVVDSGAGFSADAWGTVLGDGGTTSNGFINPSAESILTSPDIDLSPAGSAALSFASAIDAQSTDQIEVLVRDAGDDSLLQTITPYGPSPLGAPVTEDWTTYGPFDISAGAGSSIYLEFRYVGTDGNYIGWYIDDVVVTGNSAADLVKVRNLTASTETSILAGDLTQLSVSGNSLTITPAGGLVVGDDYAIQIGSNVVKNFSGLFFAGISDDVTWNFTTSFTDGSWIADADGNWSDTSNWDSGIVADGPGGTATFNLDLGAERTVTVDGDRTIGNITRDQPSSNNRLVINGDGSSTLTLEVPTGSPTITNLDSSFAGSYLRIALPLAGDDGLTKEGPGLLEITNGSTNYTGDTFINEGGLYLGSIDMANIGGGSGRNITVADGAVFQRAWPSMTNAVLNRLVETSDEIGIFLTATGGSLNNNDLDFSSGGSGADLPNAFLGTFATNGAKSQYNGIITPASDAYRWGHPKQGGSLHIAQPHPDVGGTPRGLIVGGGAVILGGENTFSGETVIRGGRLFLGRQLCLQNSALNVGNGGDGINGTICFLNSGGGGLPDIEVTDQPTLGGLIGSRNLASIYNSGNQNNTARLAIGSILGLTLDVDAGKTHTYAGNARLSSGMFLTKTGDGTQVLSGDNDYTGPTTVSGGTLGLEGGSHASAITVGTGASVEFTLGAPTTSTASLDLTDGTVKIIGVVDNASDYQLMTASSIVGTPTLDAPVPGYVLEKRNGDTELWLAVGGAALPYDTWASTNAPGQTPEEDFDLDGVENGVEFVLGGDKDTNDLDKLPGAEVSGGNLLFSFERDQTSIDPSVTVTIEVGTDLENWPSTFNVGADTGSSDAGVTVSKDDPVAGTDTVSLSVAQAPDDKKFARLKVEIAP